MGLSALRIAALASAAALAGLTPAAAAPGFAPSRPAVQADVVQVVDSATVIRRDRLHRDDGGVWKKRRHVRDRHDGDRDRDGRDGLYRPKATQKFAYDEHGNLRIYDGDGWDRGWQDDDGRDWKKKKRKRPRIYRMQSLGTGKPSPGLKGVLTTVPD